MKSDPERKPTRLQRRSGQATTIQAVAEKAGVSAMTVSNVLNGTKAVREETRLAVTKAVADLGYVPNHAARALASARQVRIGIVYRNAQNAFLSAMLVGALNAASRLGAQIMVRKCDSFAFEPAQEAITSLVRSGANALLLAPPYCEILSGSPLLAKVTIPVFTIAYGGTLPDMGSIGIDEQGAARDMTRHLIDRGHRRIGFVTGPAGQQASRDRLMGYRTALAEQGIPSDDDLIQPGDFTFESGLGAATALLDLAEPPTAIFASNDDMAAAVSLTAHRRGLRIPQDLAVAGFDDAPIAVKIWPPMTTVRQEIEAMAERATEILVASHNRGKAADTRGAGRLDYRIVIREST